MTPLHGLVLSGGRSTRMGRDKGALVYTKGQDQRTRGLELLAPFCEKVFVSVRPEQEELLPTGMPRILDGLSDSGPAAGILAAWRAHAVSWLVFACDFPEADEDLVSELVKARSATHAATAFVGPAGLLEPLFAIWEPEALRELEAGIRRGNLSPLRALAALPIRALRPSEPARLRNVNLPAAETSNIL